MSEENDLNRLGIEVLGIQNCEALISGKDFWRFLEFLESLKEKGVNPDDIKKILSLYRSSIVELILNNNSIKSMFLEEDGIVRKDLENQLTKERLNDVCDLILSGEINLDIKIANLILLEVARMIATYGMDRLNNNQSEVCDELKYMVYIKRRKSLSMEFSQQKEKLFSDRIKLGKTFGSLLIYKAEDIDLLIDRINVLIEYIYARGKFSSHIEELRGLLASANDIKNYKEKVLSNSDFEDEELPKKREEMAQKLESLFSNFQRLNKQIIFESIEIDFEAVLTGKKEGRIFLHFLQNAKVKYQLEDDGRITNAIGEEDRTDLAQNEFMIQEFRRVMINEIEKRFGEIFDINNEKHRRILQKAIEYYNDIRNNNPIYRIPMMREKFVGWSGRTYITQPLNRISVSYKDMNDMRAHLNRQIAVVVMPLTAEAIISNSVGYTNEEVDSEFGWNNFTIPEYEVLPTINETIVSASQVKSIGVVLIKSPQGICKDVYDRALELSQSMKVPLVVFDPQKVPKKENDILSQIESLIAPIEIRDKADREFKDRIDRIFSQAESNKSDRI